jgi:hypothetical protein
LCDRRLKVDIPHRRSLPELGLALLDKSYERELADEARAFVDRCVGLIPVDRQTETLPQFLEALLILGDDTITELDEIAPGNDERFALTSGC